MAPLAGVIGGAWWDECMSDFGTCWDSWMDQILKVTKCLLIPWDVNENMGQMGDLNLIFVKIGEVEAYGFVNDTFNMVAFMCLVGATFLANIFSSAALPGDGGLFGMKG